MNLISNHALLSGAAVAIALGVGRAVRERRRDLALQPIGISTNAGITMGRCRRDGTLRRRAAIYRGDGTDRI